MCERCQIHTGGRRKLWELESKLHCPVIGTCLDMEELLRFARRFGFSGDMSDEYELHVAAVHLCDERNFAARTMHKYLDRKYQPACHKFASVRGDAAVRALWQECLARGEVAGPMWAALTHRDTDPSTRQQIYADIHMLSHQVGARQAADARRLKHLEQAEREWQQGMEKERRQRQQLEQQLNRLQQLYEHERQQRCNSDQAAIELRQQLAVAQRKAEESGVQEVARRLESAEVALRRAGQRNDEQAKRLHAAEQQREALTQQNQQLHQDLAQIGAMVQTGPQGEDRLGDCQLCDDENPQRCILCVGGRKAQLVRYREIAARKGYQLLHHDGGREEGMNRLSELIQSADAVICPTDQVSHAAYYTLKQQCKRGGKPCVLFRGTGIAGFAAVLEQLR
jgi:hypothetical protein